MAVSSSTRSRTQAQPSTKALPKEQSSRLATRVATSDVSDLPQGRPSQLMQSPSLPHADDQEDLDTEMDVPLAYGAEPRESPADLRRANIERLRQLLESACNNRISDEHWDVRYFFTGRFWDDKQDVCYHLRPTRHYTQTKEKPGVTFHKCQWASDDAYDCRFWEEMHKTKACRANKRPLLLRTVTYPPTFGPLVSLQGVQQQTPPVKVNPVKELQRELDNAVRAHEYASYNELLDQAREDGKLLLARQAQEQLAADAVQTAVRTAAGPSQSAGPSTGALGKHGRSDEQTDDRPSNRSRRSSEPGGSNTNVNADSADGPAANAGSTPSPPLHLPSLLQGTQREQLGALHDQLQVAVQTFLTTLTDVLEKADAQVAGTRPPPPIALRPDITVAELLASLVPSLTRS